MSLVAVFPRTKRGLAGSNAVGGVLENIVSHLFWRGNIVPVLVRIVPKLSLPFFREFLNRRKFQLLRLCQVTCYGMYST